MKRCASETPRAPGFGRVSALHPKARLGKVRGDEGRDAMDGMTARTPVLGAICAALLLGACSGGSGTVGRACVAGGRDAATPRLCACIQSVADRTLSASDQSRAADFFDDPQLAQDTRQSDDPGLEAFWLRYRAFADSARATCG